MTKHPIEAKELAISIVMTTLILSVLGFLAIYSSSSITAYQKFGDSFFYARKQIISTAIGLVLILICIKMPENWLHKLILPGMVISFGLLVLTLIPAFQVKANGASRWIRLFGFTFQPCELAKLSLVLFMAKNLSRPRFNIENPWSAVIPTTIAFAMFATVLMLQPDLGTTVLLFLVLSIMLFSAGLNLRYFVASFLLGFAALCFAIYQAPYRMARLVSFLNPWEDAQNSGFQIIQSYLGFQNGELFGLGIGESKQKLFFLPEAHTDFILSVIGEELGFVGVGLIIACFTYLVWLGFQVVRQHHLPLLDAGCFAI